MPYREPAPPAERSEPDQKGPTLGEELRVIGLRIGPFVQALR